MTTNEALRAPDAVAIIDATRAFFPAAEGERLELPGFGELGVEGAEEIVASLNKMTLAALHNAIKLYNVFEAHPEKTAHFSETPNFVNTWVPHSRAGTAGPLPHPELVVAKHPNIAQWFVKGTEAITDPRDDQSYTGALAREVAPIAAGAEIAPKDFDKGFLLPERLNKDGVRHIAIGGIALGNKNALLCAGSTASDLLLQGFEVTLLTDAVASLTPEDRQDGIAHLASLGVHMATTDEVIAVMNTREETR